MGHFGPSSKTQEPEIKHKILRINETDSEVRNCYLLSHIS